jgi:hypothetical protein
MEWRVYIEPKGEKPAEFLGVVTATDRDDALTLAARTWQGKRFLILSALQWQSMDERGKAFYESRIAPVAYRQISADVRSCPCETCGNEIFYRIYRNRTWRKPPAWCKTCDPSPYRRKLAKHSAYTPEPESTECQTP